MACLRAVFVLMMALPAYTYASSYFAIHNSNTVYAEGYYMPSLLENNRFSLRRIVRQGSSGDTPSHDVRLSSSVLCAGGASLGLGGGGVGLKFSLEYGEFLAKKVSYFWKGENSLTELVRKYETSKISRISGTALTVNMCYEKFTAPGRFSIGLYTCFGGGATYCGISPGNYGELSPSFGVRSGVLLPLSRSLSLLFGGFYRRTFGDEYESIYDNAVSLSGIVSVPVESEKWGSSGKVSKFELTDLGLELGLRFNLRRGSAWY